MYITRISMINIQSHRNTTFDLSQGITRFAGANNNGKSVLSKATYVIVSNKITQPAYRKSIVRKGCAWGEVMYTRDDNVSLLVHIALEAAATYAVLTRADGTQIRRYLSDKVIPELVQEFGFHYLSTGDLSLNIHQDEDKPLIVNTHPKINYDLLSPARADPLAEKALENLKIQQKFTKMQLTEVDKAVAVNTATLNTLQMYDIDKETAVKNKLMYLVQNLSNIPNTKLPEVKAVPQVLLLPKTQLPKLRYPAVLNVTCTVPDITNIWADIQELKKGRCPLCEREF